MNAWHIYSFFLAASCRSSARELHVAQLTQLHNEIDKIRIIGIKLTLKLITLKWLHHHGMQVTTDN